MDYRQEMCAHGCGIPAVMCVGGQMLCMPCGNQVQRLESLRGEHVYVDGVGVGVMTDLDSDGRMADVRGGDWRWNGPVEQLRV